MGEQFLMDLADYKRYFKEYTEYPNNYDHCIILCIEPIDNPNDKDYEYSIRWENMDNEENGIIKGINTSSIFALKSCNWYNEDF